MGLLFLRVTGFNDSFEGDSYDSVRPQLINQRDIIVIYPMTMINVHRRSPFGLPISDAVVTA